jgi:hypothetical protein
MNSSNLRSNTATYSVYGIAAGVASWGIEKRPGLSFPKKPR